MNERHSLMPWGLRMPIWKMNLCSRFLRLSVAPWCRERPQTDMCSLEWLGRLKCWAYGFCYWSVSCSSRSAWDIPTNVRKRINVMLHENGNSLARNRMHKRESKRTNEFWSNPSQVHQSVTTVLFSFTECIPVIIYQVIMLHVYTQR